MSARSEDRQGKIKSVLYCPGCGHESPIPAVGDWIVHESGETAMYECPDCGTVVASRPVGSAGDVPAPC